MTVTGMSAAEPLFGGAHPFIITSTLGAATSEWAGVVVE